MYEQGLSIGLAMVLGLIGAAALLLAVVRFRFALLFVGAMLFISALGVPLDFSKNLIRLWILPMQAARSQLFLGAALFLIAAAAVNVARLRFGRISGPAVMATLIGFYAGMVRLVSGFPEDGMASMVFAVITIPIVAIVVTSLIDEWDDFYRPLRIIALTSVVWVGGVGVQFVIAWKKLVVQHGLSRFHGLLANPQHAAVFTSVVCITCLFLLLNDPKQRYKPLWAALAGINGIFVLWTGSRTGLGMLGIGLMSVLYARIGRAILLLPVVGLVGLLAFNFLMSSNIEFDLEGLVSRGDTRSAVWRRMLEEISANPLFGVGLPKDIPSENSFLFGMASYGVGMGFLLFLTVVVVGVQVLGLWRRKRMFPIRERRLIELLTGFYAMYFAGAMFEGYMIARVSTSLVFLLIFGAIGTRLAAMGKALQYERRMRGVWDDEDEAMAEAAAAAEAYEAGEREGAGPAGAAAHPA